MRRAAVPGAAARSIAWRNRLHKVGSGSIDMATTTLWLTIVVLQLLSSAASCFAAGAMLSTVLFTGSTSPVPAGSSPPSAATTESPAGESAGSEGKVGGASPIGAYIGEAAAALVVLIIVVLVVCRCYTNRKMKRYRFF
ncbi:unnamed protein product [Sphagnum troendelagicum]|uniref:Uncharacterized protein n=1 Tax=Sphagnum troendelagicum TaxID=128251 RepID=A0ABP0UT99_9BRYO